MLQCNCKSHHNMPFVNRSDSDCKDIECLVGNANAYIGLIVIIMVELLAGCPARIYTLWECQDSARYTRLSLIQPMVGFNP